MDKLPRNLPTPQRFYRPPLPIPQYVICYRKFLSNVNNGEWSETWSYLDHCSYHKLFTRQSANEKAVDIQNDPDQYRDIYVMELIV